MKNISIKSLCFSMALLPLMLMLASCSGDDYLNAIPDDSTALVALDMLQLSADGKTDVLNGMLGVDDVDGCGIDLSSKLYVFTTAEGSVGLAAKVDDDGALDEWLGRMSQKGFCVQTSKRKDFGFTVIKDSWVAGFSSGALVVLGPVLPSQQADAQRRIIKYLEQDEEHSVKATPMFARLDTIGAPVALVAQAAALPEKMVAPFTLGAPKNADASQVMIAAELNPVDDGCVVVSGETFSFNKSVDEALKAARGVFRPITDKYLANMSDSASLGVFMNVDGTRFIELLNANKSFQALLAGVNTAIDMNNIIKSIDGDVAVMLPDLSKGMSGVQMCAKLKSKAFLADVGYWKQSCPVGSRITDWKKDAYCFTNGDISYYFGVTPDLQYYSGMSEAMAEGVLSAASSPLSAAVRQLVVGRRLVMLLNVGSLKAGGVDYGNYLKTLFGGADTVIYIMK